MLDVQVGIVGLGNVGSGALTILAENADQIAARLGFRLRVAAVACRNPAGKTLPEGIQPELVTGDWRQVVNHPGVEVVAELVGGTGAARQVVETALDNGKSVVTANKELMALAGPEIWARAQAKGASLAMEASVCGGIPVHAVLREGIAADRVETFYGILNGTCNFILTEIESRAAAFDDVLREAQARGFAEADPTADVEGYDARSKLALLAAVAFGLRVKPEEIHTEGIRRISPIDFQYAAKLGCTIRLLCAARRAAEGVFLSVRPALLPAETILAGVRGSYNALWVKGRYGADTFYYGRGAGPHPTGVAVVSDLMRVAADIRSGRSPRPSPYSCTELRSGAPLPVAIEQRPWYLRFRVQDRPGIIAQLAAILAENQVNLDAVLQLPYSDKQNLPFVITVESAREEAIRTALAAMARLPFHAEPPLALPMESAL